MDILPLYPRPVKVEDVKVEIIDVDSYESKTDLVTAWNLNVRSKMLNYFCNETPETLVDLMKNYKEDLLVLDFEICQKLMECVKKHIEFFYLSFKCITWLSTDPYLECMEDILASYLDLEGHIFIKEKDKRKRQKKIIREKLLILLKSYLMGREERVHHVLMKIKIHTLSDEASGFVDHIFKIVMSQKPHNKSDIAFCRAYILFQKWKKVVNESLWKTLDDLLYELYSRDVNSIHKNIVWKKMSQQRLNNSLIDSLHRITGLDEGFCESYFKYMKSLNLQDDPDIELIQITDHPSSPISDHMSIMEKCVEEFSIDDEESFDMKCETLEDSDDDCIIIENDKTDESELIHEVVDDDEISSIIYFKPKQMTPILNTVPRRKDNEPVEIVPTNIVSTSNYIPNTETNEGNHDSDVIPVSIDLPPQSNLDNVDNDSVQSREILSRKFTRKKAAPDPESELQILVELNEWDDPKTLNMTEPSDRFVGLVTPPTSHEDHNSYEAELNSPNLEKRNDEVEDTCEVEVENEKEKNNVNKAHSTFYSTSQESLETSSSGQSTSMISPNITDTCDLNVEQLPLLEERQSEEHKSVEQPTQKNNNHNDNDVPEVPVVEAIKINDMNCGTAERESSNNGQLSDHIDPNNENTEKQLMVSVSRIDVSPKKNEVVYSQKINPPDHEVHQRYDDLKACLSMDDCLSGSLEKVITAKNLPDMNGIAFDLFNEAVPQENVVEAGPVQSERLANSPSDLNSPAYDDIDDFGNYFKEMSKSENCQPSLLEKSDRNRNIITPTEPQINSYLVNRAPPKNGNITPPVSQINGTIATSIVTPLRRHLMATLRQQKNGNIIKTPPVLQKRGRAKRKKIAFAKEDIIDVVNTYEPIINSENIQVHGILKKANKTLSGQINGVQINLASLEKYQVELNNPHLHMKPVVEVKWYSAEELMNKYSRELAQRKRLEAAMNSHNTPMKVFRINYDKSTRGINEYDTVLFNEPEDFKSNSIHREIDNKEGTVTKNSTEEEISCSKFAKNSNNMSLCSRDLSVSLCNIPILSSLSKEITTPVNAMSGSDYLDSDRESNKAVHSSTLECDIRVSGNSESTVDENNTFNRRNLNYKNITCGKFTNNSNNTSLRNKNVSIPLSIPLSNISIPNFPEKITSFNTSSSDHLNSNIKINLENSSILESDVKFPGNSENVVDDNSVDTRNYNCENISSSTFSKVSNTESLSNYDVSDRLGLNQPQPHILIPSFQSEETPSIIDMSSSEYIVSNVESNNAENSSAIMSDLTNSENIDARNLNWEYISCSKFAKDSNDASICSQDVNNPLNLGQPHILILSSVPEQSTFSINDMSSSDYLHLNIESTNPENSTIFVSDFRTSSNNESTLDENSISLRNRNRKNISCCDFSKNSSLCSKHISDPLGLGQPYISLSSSVPVEPTHINAMLSSDYLNSHIERNHTDNFSILESELRVCNKDTNAADDNSTDVRNSNSENSTNLNSASLCNQDINDLLNLGQLHISISSSVAGQPNSFVNDMSSSEYLDSSIISNNADALYMGERTPQFKSINQPSIVPEVEEYERKMKSEEVTKVSAIPSDPNNLTVPKISPIPPIQTFSLQLESPANNYFCYTPDTTNENLILDVTTINESKQNDEQFNQTVSKPAPNQLNLSEEELETKLPFKKRKRSTVNGEDDTSFKPPETVDDLLKFRKTSINDTLGSARTKTKRGRRENKKKAMQIANPATLQINKSLFNPIKNEEINYSETKMKKSTAENVENKPVMSPIRNPIEDPVASSNSYPMMPPTSYPAMPLVSNPMEIDNENNFRGICSDQDVIKRDIAEDLEVKPSIDNSTSSADVKEWFMSMAEVHDNTLGQWQNSFIEFAQESIANKHVPRTFKTPAQKKEMPPDPKTHVSLQETATVETEKYNVPAYNDPTMNYLVNNNSAVFLPVNNLYTLTPLYPFLWPSIQQQQSQQTPTYSKVYCSNENQKQEEEKK